MKRVVTAAFVLVAVVQSTPAAAVRDLRDGWLLTAGQVSRLMDPAAAGRNRWWLSAATGRLYGLPELPQLRAAAGGDVPGPGPRLAWSAAWETLGRELVRDRQVELQLVLGRSRRLGVVWQHADLSIAGVAEARYRGWAIRLGRVWSTPRGLGSLEIRIPLDEGPQWYGPNGRRTMARVALLRPERGFAAVAALDRRGDGSFVGGAEVDLAFGTRLVMGLRSDPATGSLGPVTVWRSGVLLVRTSHLVHPELGVTHRCELVVGRPGASTP